MRYVYTAVVGGIGDTVRAPLPRPSAEGVRWVIFTDRPRNKVPPPWEVRPAVVVDPSSRRTARWHKINAHLALPEATESLWLDGCLMLCDPPAALFAYLAGADVAAFRHHDRDCVYEEALACTILRKDDPKVIKAQMRRYQLDGYPIHAGLAETTTVVRRHTHAVARLNALWWSELSAGSLRDQLSFDWCCRKLGVRYAHVAGRRERSPHFRFFGHR